MADVPGLSLNTLVLLTLLVQFQKYEISNPYAKRLQTIRSDVTLQVRCLDFFFNTSLH